MTTSSFRFTRSCIANLFQRYSYTLTDSCSMEQLPVTRLVNIHPLEEHESNEKLIQNF
jgi:hypothetical protein